MSNIVITCFNFFVIIASDVITKKLGSKYEDTIFFSILIIMRHENIYEKILKVVIIFLTTVFSCSYVPRSCLSADQILIISSIVTIVYIFIETYYPSVYIKNFQQ